MIDGEERAVEEVGDRDGRRDGEQDTVAAQEAETGGDRREVALPRHPDDGGRRQQGGDEQRRGDEAGGVEPEDVAGPEQGDERPGDRRAEESRAALDALEGGVRALRRHPRLRGGVGAEGTARGIAGGVAEGAKEDEHEQLPEGQPDRVVQQRDERDDRAAGEVGEDAGALVAEAIDERAAEDRGDHGGERLDEGGDAGLGGAPGGDEHEPGDRDQGELAADQRDRIGGEEGVEGGLAALDRCWHRRRRGHHWRTSCWAMQGARKTPWRGPGRPGDCLRYGSLPLGSGDHGVSPVPGAVGSRYVTTANA